MPWTCGGHAVACPYFYLCTFVFYLYMIYPDDFEAKIGFDRIRKMLSERCLSSLGREMTEVFTFMSDFGIIRLELSKTSEFQQILNFDDPFPSENYFDTAGTLNKLRIEGTFPEVEELFDLKRSLETIKAILNYFRAKEEKSYPVLKSLCKNVKQYPYVLDSVDRIIDRHGNIKDNASHKLREIRSELSRL